MFFRATGLPFCTMTGIVAHARDAVGCASMSRIAGLNRTFGSGGLRASAIGNRG
jgi:hypothetical protein